MNDASALAEFHVTYTFSLALPAAWTHYFTIICLLLFTLIYC